MTGHIESSLKLPLRGGRRSRVHYFAPLLLAALACAGPALADDVQSNSLRIGLYAVFFHAKADDLSGPYVPPGTNFHFDNIQTLYLAYVRRLSSKWEVELALGVPPKTKTEGAGPPTLGSVPYDGQVITTARWLSPTVLFNYQFLSENSKWRPYIGVGVNYTNFYDRDSTAAGDAAAGGPTKISLTSSVGPAATMGIRYKIDSHWRAYASYSFSRVTTDLTADTVGVIRTTHISFGPQALIIAVGYSF